MRPPQRTISKLLTRFSRMGFAVYLVEAMCDIALSLILYVLLRPVHGISPFSPRSCLISTKKEVMQSLKGISALSCLLIGLLLDCLPAIKASPIFRFANAEIARTAQPNCLQRLTFSLPSVTLSIFCMILSAHCTAAAAIERVRGLSRVSNRSSVVLR